MFLRRIRLTIFSHSKCLSFGIGLCAISFTLFTPVLSSAQGLADASNDAINAILLLDNSGSMLDNDPERLRDAGTRLFMQFLKQGDSLGIISFSDSTQTVRPLSPFAASEIDGLASQVSKIEATGQYTDITNAIVAAQTMLATATNGNKNVIILLSDGKLDPPPSAGKKDDLLDKLVLQLLPALKTKSTPVYTLAFSGDADKALLGKISDLTDGVNWFTPSSDKIHESFAELFLSVKKPQIAPASEKGFRIDPDIEEATFYVNRVPDQEVYLESPKGRIFTAKITSDNLRWFQTDKFDVITIETPEAGEWKLSGVSQDEGFATILTNLKLVSTFPTALSTHKPAILQAQLYDSKLPVSLPDMANVVKYAFQIASTDKVAEPILRDFLNDDGKDGDEKAGDGIFSKKITLDEEGEYRLRIVAKSPTFERQQSIPFRVRPPAVTLTVEQSEAVEEKPEDEHAKATEKPADDAVTSISKSANFNVTVNESDDFIKNLKVTLTAVDSKKSRYTIPVKQAASDMLYTASGATLPADGRFTLTATMQGTNRAGKAVREDSDPVTVNRIPSVPVAGEETKEVIVVEPTAKEVFPTSMLLLAIFGNIIIGAVGFGALKGLTGKGGKSISTPPIAPEIETALLNLQKAKEIQALQIDDPRYAEAQGE